MEKVKGCRICGAACKEVLNLGNLYPSTFIRSETDYDQLKKAPLVLGQCAGCGLVQLLHTVDRDELFRQYWYKSGLNSSMVRDLRGIVNDIRDRIDLYTGDVVVDIGANDGTMLSMFPNYVVRVGIEPATNLLPELEAVADLVVPEYFSEDVIPNYIAKPKVITSIAVFYDLPDPNKFCEDVYKLLDPHGIWVIQMADLKGMLETNAFDNICHEHLEYYSLATLEYLLANNGFRIFDVSYNNTNGRSLRVFADKWVREPSAAVGDTLRLEYAYFDKFEDPMKAFANRVEQIRKLVRGYLEDMCRTGSTIYGMGASTKGNTLLQYFGINSNLLDCIVEINEDKYGLMTVGSNIPIFPQAFVGETLAVPNVYVPLPWHFIDGFVEHNQEFLDNGGVFFVPLPEPTRIFIKDGEKWVLKERLLES